MAIKPATLVGKMMIKHDLCNSLMTGFSLWDDPYTPCVWSSQNTHIMIKEFTSILTTDVDVV